MKVERPMSKIQNLWYKPIVFTLEDGEKVTFSHEDFLVISTVLYNFNVYRVLIDDGSAMNILSKDTLL
jgi:hypothetical protein